jgi:hypothetical protein
MSAQNTPETAPGATLADELVQLALDDSEPETCGCGAVWDTERALAVVARAAGRTQMSKPDAQA